MRCYLYILKSLKDKQYYVGITDDVEKRLKQHNAGKTQSTKSRRPFIIVHTETYNSKQDARNREKYLKSYTGVNEKRKILDNVRNIGE